LRKPQSGEYQLCQKEWLKHWILFSLCCLHGSYNMCSIVDKMKKKEKDKRSLNKSFFTTKDA